MSYPTVLGEIQNFSLAGVFWKKAVYGAKKSDYYPNREINSKFLVMAAQSGL